MEKENRKTEEFFHKGNIIFSLIWIVFGLFICLYDIMNYPIYDDQGMGAGFFPLALGIVIAVVGIILLIMSLSGKFDKTEGVVPDAESLKHIFLFIVCSIIVVLLSSFLGMVISMAVFLFATLKIIYGESWIGALVIAIIASAVIWLIFDIGFQIAFPTGILGFI